MKVTLIGMSKPTFDNATPTDVMFTAMSQCYNKSFDIDDAMAMNSEQKDKVTKAVLNSGHHSVSEHINFTFLIEDVSRACYDKETEVLTKNGWKLFKDLLDDDKIATLNPHTKLVEFQNFKNRTEYHYTGKLHSYKSESVNLMVTPNHNMYIKKYDVRRPVDFVLAPSENIHIKRFYMNKQFKYKNIVEDFVNIDSVAYERRNNQGHSYTKYSKPLTIDKSLFVKFLAFYLSDGSTTYSKRYNSYRITITQNAKSIYGYEINTDTRNDIIDTITKMGFKCTVTDTTISFASYSLGAMLSQIGVSYKKYIPYNIFDFFDEDYAKLFIDSYVKYDGTEYKGHKFIYTTSKKLCDQIQQIAFIAGYGSSIYIDDRIGQTHELCGTNVRHNHIQYRISLTKTMNNNEVLIKERHRSYVDYDDMVYCVEVPNHILYVRRNGLTCWCGNCTHQLVRHRLASYSQRSGRYTGLEDGDWYVIPPSIAKKPEAVKLYIDTLSVVKDAYLTLTDEMNIPKEDARFLLPNGQFTNIAVTMNCRTLKNFFGERLCNRAQWEIRDLAKQMTAICKKHLPIVFEDAKFGYAKCEQLGYCPESKKHNCGKMKTLPELLSK